MFLAKLFGKIFNRVTLTALAVLAQLAWLLSLFLGLAQYQIWFSALFTVLSALIALYIVRKDDNSAYKIGWIVIIGLVPLLGGLLYLFFGNKRPSKKMRRRIERTQAEHYAALAARPGVTDGLPPRMAATSRYLTDHGPYPPWQHTAVRYFPSGEAMFPQMLADMERAERFIFVEYFIISKGSMWNEMFDVLKRKAAAGVDVRVIYDDVGSVWAMPKNFAVELEKNHIHCLPFNPMVPVLAFVMNNRDHRKILVIDGNVGYTGGINIADEYVNRIERFGYWKDTGVRLEGDAVWNLTVTYLNLWNSFRKMDESYAAFRPTIQGQTPTDGVVQPYTDSPLDEEPLAENVYLDILAQAERYVYIFTPYLIIDNEMTNALCLAAKRGVEVCIVTPAIPDKKLVFRLTRSYYATLLRAGVRIYEYTPGFIHAKSFVCDDRIAVVGSVNMDYRSLYLHFESAVLLMECSMIRELKQDALDTIRVSRPVALADCRQGFLGTLLDDLLRLLSPLL